MARTVGLPIGNNQPNHQSNLIHQNQGGNGGGGGAAAANGLGVNMNSMSLGMNQNLPQLNHMNVMAVAAQL